MGNYSFVGKEISKILDKKTIQNGGLQLVTMPTASIKIEENMILKVGGYKSFINYNKYREQEHKDIKFQKKMRSLRRNIKQKRLRQSGLTVNTGVPRAKDS